MSTGTYRHLACAGCGVLSPDLPLPAIDYLCSSCSPDGVASCRQHLSRTAPQPDLLREQAREHDEPARTRFLARPLRPGPS